VAAFGVVCLHFGQSYLPAGPVRRLVGAGYLGVNLFFLLSGFILAYGYLTVSGRMRCPARAFYAARFARIYPVYLVGFALALLALARWGVSAAPFYARLYLAHPVAVPLSTLLLVQGWLPPWQ
jgi:peptidoglycan/LPS O-acetylase OafA/YrhL